MAEAMDFAKVFLTVLDKKALRGASWETAHDPRSLHERFLAMTKRANDAQADTLHYMNRVDSADRDYAKLWDRHEKSRNRRGLNIRAEVVWPVRDQ